MNRSFSLAVGCILVVSLLGAKAPGQNMVVQQVGSRTELSLDGGQPFHTTEAQVTGARLIGVSGSAALIGLWNESPGAGEIVPHYAVSLDGVGFFPARSTEELSLAVGPTFQSVISDPPEGVDPDVHREKAFPAYFFNDMLGSWRLCSVLLCIAAPST